jgi:predicted MPP superfamily phosphohydrolase
MFYGLWNASRPVLKTQEVYITNIPEAWENKKVLFLADVHLGLVWSKNFFQKIVDIVNEEGADIVFISGDLFD